MHEDTQASAQSNAIYAWLAKNVLMLPLLAISGWSVATTQASEIKLAALAEKISYMGDTIKEDRSNRYTAADAAKDFRMRDELSSNIAGRVLVLEKRSGISEDDIVRLRR